MPIKLKPIKKIKREIAPPPRTGDVLDGKIICFEKNSLFLDLGAQGIGIIYGAEYQQAKDQLKNKKKDDAVSVKIINIENDDGYRELSAVEASREFAWQSLQEKKDNGEALNVKIKGANKGGLLCLLNGIPGFIPASQLSAKNYPKVENGDTSKIALALQELVGKTLKLKILDIDPSKDKLIFSEKAIPAIHAKQSDLQPTDLKQGDLVEGAITGVTNFGVFVGLKNNIEGLVKSEEIKGQGKDEEKLKIGQKVKAKVSEINDGRIYLSLKNK